jgi:hypothetical protein
VAGSVSSEAVSPPPPEHWPAVSLIVLAGDVSEARTIVKELLADPYPGDFEIVLAAASSVSHPAVTDPVDRLAEIDSRVVVVHGKDEDVAGLLNAAAFASRHGVISPVRPASGRWTDLLRRAVAAMEVTGADVVGGVDVAVGLGSWEVAVSRAMNSRLGVGPRPSRVGAAKGPVDSVGMVAIRRQAFERVGGLAAAFKGARDWELQHRVRRAGGMVWLDPSLALRRRSPAGARELARVFFRTGAWRRRIIATHSDTSTWRYLVPPTLVALLVACCLGGIVGGAMGVTAMWALTAVPLVYMAGVAIGVVAAGTGLRPGARVRMWWAVMVIHLSWGAGFLFGRTAGPARRERAGRRIP